MKRIISLVMLSLFHCLKHLTSNPIQKYIKKHHRFPINRGKKQPSIPSTGVGWAVGGLIRPTAGESRLLANLPSASFSDFEDNRVVARVDLEETSKSQRSHGGCGGIHRGGNLGTRCPCFRAKWINEMKIVKVSQELMLEMI